MKMQKSALFALLSLAVSTMAVAPFANAQTGTAVTPITLLGLGVHSQAPSGAARSVPNPAVLGLASARVYRFASADYPGAGSSLVFDENVTTGTVLGDSSFNSSFGFTLHGGLYQQFSVPGQGANGNLTTGINTGGAIVGIYSDLSNTEHGFLDNGGTFTNIDVAAGTQTEPIGINDSGEIVGGYIDASSVTHGFYTLDSGATFHIFDVPGATATTGAGVNTAGIISGVWSDAMSHNHGFLYDGTNFTSFDFPGATGTTGIGINDTNEVAGYYFDAANVEHGFIYSAGAFTKVDVPGASQTQLTRIKNKGQITGIYTDSNTPSGESHGLTGR